MALQTSGPISISDICGPNGLNIGFNPPQRELHELGNLANTSSLPYINRATPSIFDWYNYQNAIYGGTILLNIPGFGNDVPPNAPGSGVISNYTLGSGITIKNTNSTETILFTTPSLSNPYPIIAQSGAARLMQFASTTGVYFNTAPGNGETIPPNSFATWLSFGKSSGSGVVVLSLETQTNAGGRQQFFWSFNI